MSDFMTPNVEESEYYSIETNEGTTIIPLDVCGVASSVADLADYLEGTVDNDDWYEDCDLHHSLMKGVNRFLLKARRAKTRHLRNRYERLADRVMGELMTQAPDPTIPIIPTIESGWLYRLSASGYMDRTDWGVADSEQQAWRELLDQYGDDGDEWVTDARMKANRCTQCDKDLPPDNQFGFECSNKCSADALEKNGPEDEDWVTDDYETFREHNGSNTLETTPDTWMADLSARMDEEDFFPNVWYQGERGDWNVLSMETGEYLRYKK